MFAQRQSLPYGCLAPLLVVVAIAWPASGYAQERSLYDRLGGLAPISVVVSDFIDALVPDPMLNANPAPIREGRRQRTC